MEKFGYTHLSTGDLLREEVKKDTERARMLNEIMKEGKLVPQVNYIILLRPLVNAGNFRLRFSHPGVCDISDVTEKMALLSKLDFSRELNPLNLISNMLYILNHFITIIIVTLVKTL